MSQTCVMKTVESNTRNQNYSRKSELPRVVFVISKDLIKKFPPVICGLVKTFWSHNYILKQDLRLQFAQLFSETLKERGVAVLFRNTGILQHGAFAIYLSLWKHEFISMNSIDMYLFFQYIYFFQSYFLQLGNLYHFPFSSNRIAITKIGQRRGGRKARASELVKSPIEYFPRYIEVQIQRTIRDSFAYLLF